MKTIDNWTIIRALNKHEDLTEHHIATALKLRQC